MSFTLQHHECCVLLPFRSSRWRTLNPFCRNDGSAVDCTVCSLYRFVALLPESTALKRPAGDLSEESAGMTGGNLSKQINNLTNIFVWFNVHFRVIRVTIVYFDEKLQNVTHKMLGSVDARWQKVTHHADETAGLLNLRRSLETISRQRKYHSEGVAGLKLPWH